MANLSENPNHRDLRDRLDGILTRRLTEIGDEFLPGTAYIERFGIELDSEGDVLIRP